jgi:hypothetical protein
MSKVDTPLSGVNRLSVEADADRARLAFHRKLFLWSHAILAFFSVLAYLRQMALGPLAFTFLPGYGEALLFISLPALWPYLVSAIASWQFVSERRFGLYLFLSALTASGVLSIALALGAFGVVTDRWSLLGVYYNQSGAHYFISWLLDVEIGRRPS